MLFAYLKQNMKKKNSECFQSLAVQRAAYSSPWHNQSTELNKLMQIFIMRAQKPVKLIPEKFYNVSLKTSGDVRSLIQNLHELDT
jgi:hypothetical protein